MASSFPTSLDTFTNPSSTDAMDSVSVPHATQHSDLNDAVEALQAKVGVDSSAVTTSLDYKVAQLEAISHGKILQVVSTTKTDTFSASVAAGSTVDVTGLTVTITPSATSSTILVQANIHGSNSNGPRGTASFFVQRDSTPILIGDAASNRTRVSGAQHDSTAFAENIASTLVAGEDSPATTSAITYKVTAHNITGSTSTVYINRTGSDVDQAYTPRTVSSITVMEVSA